MPKADGRGSRNRSNPKLAACRSMGIGHALVVVFPLLVLICSITAPATTLAQTPPSNTAGSQELDSEFLDDDLDFLDEEEPDAAPPIIVRDPIEPWNRFVFQFNNDAYFLLIRPAARAYKTVVPGEIRYAVKNFFFNLGSVFRFTNCVLQGKFRKAGNEFGRFFINTTVGLGGLWTPSERYPSLNPDPEDLGQTLGHWGVGNGLYIVWPLLGPSTLRDSSGFVGDWLYNRYVYNLDSATAIGLYTLTLLNDASYRLGDYETILEAVIDPYASVRDGYIQYRDVQVRK